MDKNNLPIKINFPDGYFKDETRNGYMISQKMKKIWAVEMDLLLEFDRVCKENKLNYYLDSGTLLGAVRHKGFIPWDDDIDVIMMREDYDRLIKQCSSCFKHPYFLQHAGNEENYFRHHAQLRNSLTTAMLPYEAAHISINQGIFIDIFVLDGVTKERRKLQKQIRRQNYYRRVYQFMCLHYSKNKVKQLIMLLASPFLKLRYKNSFTLFEEYEKVIKQYDDEEYVDNVGLCVSPDRVHYMDRRWFDRSISIEFEGFYFPAPSEFDSVLIEYYGRDYMTPRREPTLHGSMIINPEIPYKEFLKNMKKQE